MRNAATVLVVLLAATEARAHGRFASVGLGGSASMQAGSSPPPVPALLQYAPELQLGYGIHAGSALVLTRLDLLGLMVPVGPAGVGLDVGAGWTPGWARDGWAPVLRGFIGGLLFGSGGEMLGPDHSSYGFRLTAEAGVVHRTRVPAGTAAWGIVVGAQAIGLVDVDPCSATGKCDTALLGLTVRLEGQLVF